MIVGVLGENSGNRLILKMCDNWLSHLTLPTSTIINFDSNKTKSCERLCSHHARQLSEIYN